MDETTKDGLWVFAMGSAIVTFSMAVLPLVLIYHRWIYNLYEWLWR